jgi:hypothetical protein
MSTEAPAAPVEATPAIVIETPLTPATPDNKPLWRNIQVSEQPSKSPDKAPEKPAEAPVAKEPEKVTPEPTKTPESAPKSGKEESLANLRKKLEDQTKELEDFRNKYSTIEKEYTEHKTKPVELPEEIKTKLTTLETEREQYARELKAAKLERHPEFQKKYQEPIQTQIAYMQKIARDAGIEEAVLKDGFGNWNGAMFGEWAESMTAEQRVKFTAAWMNTEDLDRARVQELQNAESTWTEMQKAHEAQAKSEYESAMSQNEKLAKGLVKKLILDNESTKDFEDLPGIAEAVALKAARYELSPQEVFEAVISNQALARMHGKQKTVIEERDATIAELQKKLEDQEAFIKEHAGSTPRPDATGVIPKGAAKESPLWNVQIRA